jgi:Fe-S oxidoreductase
VAFPVSGLWVQRIAFVLITGYALFLFGQAVYRRVLFMRLGRPNPERKARIWPQIGRPGRTAFVRQVFGHSKLLKDRRSGIMHLALFYGFIVLQFGAIDLIVKGLGGTRLPLPFYPVFTLFQEITVGIVLLAVAYAACRRYRERLPRLNRGWKPGVVLLFIAFLMFSVLFALAFERLRNGLPAAPDAPLSSLLAAVLAGITPSPAAAEVGFFVSWWAHLGLLLAFLVYVPQSKHFHLLTAPVNIWLRRTEPAGRLRKLDLEDENAESFGAGKIEDFTRKQLLDLYACVECGRCTNACPASNTGKTLSPMHLIVKLRDHLTEKGAAVTSRSPWVPAYLFAGGHGGTGGSGGAHRVGAGRAAPGSGRAVGEESANVDWTRTITDIRPTMAYHAAAWSTDPDARPEALTLIGDVITEEEIWACTTCRSCEEQCPVGNEHVDKIVDLRRHLVLMEGSLPADAQRAMQNIERQGNPWGLHRRDRMNWTQELAGIPVPVASEGAPFDVLFYVGSMGSYDNRSRKVTRAVVRLMLAAGVRFAVLGNEERGSGDTPRRMGNELLFQQLCEANIALFNKYGVTKIVTACPHTYNMLKNEYPDFGMEGIEVMHHTEFLAELVRAGRLVPRYSADERVTYHDSCYLGRYNGVFDPPRAILASIPGVELLEMARSRENGMCCGAGGGRMWMEEKAGKRVNIARTEQALAVNPTAVASACPYCLTMLEDGAKALGVEARVRTLDVAELLERAVFGGTGGTPEQ